MSEPETPVEITIKVGRWRMYYRGSVITHELENDTEAQLEKIIQSCRKTLLGGSHRFKASEKP